LVKGVQDIKIEQRLLDQMIHIKCQVLYKRVF
jgi:hypothetical protein